GGLFAERLAAPCRDRLGVSVRLGARVTALESGGDHIETVLTSDGERHAADNYVLALGVGSPIVARTAGVSLPIYPAKGYSSTFPLRRRGPPPPPPGGDEKGLGGWSRFGGQPRPPPPPRLP